MASRYPDLEPALTSRFPVRPRILIGLQRNQGVSREEFGAALRDWKSEREVKLRPHNALVRAGLEVPESRAELQEVLIGNFSRSSDDVGTAISELSGYITLDLEEYHPSDGDFDTLIELASDGLGGLDAVLDRERSFAIAGVAHLVIPGVAPEAMVLFGREQPTVSLVELYEWWLEHGEVAIRIQRPLSVGYHQVQITHGLSDLAADRCGVARSTYSIGDVLYLAQIKDFYDTLRGRATQKLSERHLAHGETVGTFVDFADAVGGHMREF
jgi:hypothetical protein